MLGTNLGDDFHWSVDYDGDDHVVYRDIVTSRICSINFVKSERKKRLRKVSNERIKLTKAQRLLAIDDFVKHWTEHMSNVAYAHGDKGC